VQNVQIGWIHLQRGRIAENKLKNRFSLGR
jgi:hypothetical protein